MKNKWIIDDKNFLKSQIFIEKNHDDFYIMSSKKFIDKILNIMTNSMFKTLEEIDINNLRYFWSDALEAYQNKIISKIDVFDIVDSLENYINRRFEDDYPEFEWLNFPDYDLRSIGVATTWFVRDAIIFGDLTFEFVQTIQTYLKTESGEEQKSNNHINQIFDNLLAAKGFK